MGKQQKTTDRVRKPLTSAEAEMKPGMTAGDVSLEMLRQVLETVQRFDFVDEEKRLQVLQVAVHVFPLLDDGRLMVRAGRRQGPRNVCL